MKKPLNPDEARARLEALCSRSEQCSADALHKLASWGIYGDTAGEIIDSLIDRRYIDDARFARAFTSDKYRFAGWGRHKIRSALISRHIPSQTIDDSLATIDSRTYQTRAFEAFRSKIRQLDRSDVEKCREKLIRFGMSRGYETSLILRIINSRRLWLDS